MLSSLPQAEWMLADRGCGVDWAIKDTLKNRSIMACIPRRKGQEKAVRYDKRRNRIEIMFGRLRD